MKEKDIKYFLEMHIFSAFNSLNANDAYKKAKEIVEKNKDQLTEQKYYQLYEYTEFLYSRRNGFNNSNVGRIEWIPEWEN